MASLKKSLKVCRVNAGEANRLESDRFQNSDNLLCPVWNGRDEIGRSVIGDSTNIKLRGCNLPLDRVVVENNLRANHSLNPGLDTYGISAPFSDQKPMKKICDMTDDEIAIEAQERRNLVRLQAGIQDYEFKVASGMD